MTIFMAMCAYLDKQEESEYIDKMMDYKPNVDLQDIDGYTGLHHAIRNKNHMALDILSYDLENDQMDPVYKVDHSLRSKNFENAVHLAARTKDASILHRMLKAGCDPLAYNLEGQSPLDLL